MGLSIFDLLLRRGYFILCIASLVGAELKMLGMSKLIYYTATGILVFYVVRSFSIAHVERLATVVGLYLFFPLTALTAMWWPHIPAARFPAGKRSRWIAETTGPTVTKICELNDWIFDFEMI